jgi:6,7-dimethyl-8-ribityllumazine synthase
VLIVSAEFYPDISAELIRGATAAIEASAGTWEKVVVPGAFEAPGAIRIGMDRRVDTGRGFDGYVALGCVVRGETSHYDYVCGESARGLQELAIRHGLAIGYGILTVENLEQAWARARVEQGGNKGRDAAMACLSMIALRRRFGVAS